MKGIDAVREAAKIQMKDGNWNYSPYMHGLANGLILALALIDDSDFAYLAPPDQWIQDRTIPERQGTKPDTLGSGLNPVVRGNIR